MTRFEAFGWPVTIAGGGSSVRVIGGQRCVVSRNGGDGLIYTLEALEGLGEAVRGEQWSVPCYERHRREWGESLGGVARVGTVRGGLWVPAVAELRVDAAAVARRLEVVR